MLPWIIIVTVLIVAGISVARSIIQPDSEMIALWAMKEALTILEAKRCYLWHGPFAFSRIEGAVYAIVVEDLDSKRREGCLCIPYGQWKKSRVDVHWKSGCFVN